MIKNRVGKNVRDRADWDGSLARVNTMHCNMLHTSHQRFIHTCTHTPRMSTCHTSVSSPVALQLQLLRRGRQTRMCTARCKWHRMAPSRSTQENRPPSSLPSLTMPSPSFSLLCIIIGIIHVLNHVRNENQERSAVIFPESSRRLLHGKGVAFTSKQRRAADARATRT